MIKSIKELRELEKGCMSLDEYEDQLQEHIFAIEAFEKVESLIKDRIKELEEEMKKHKNHHETDEDKSYCPIKPDNCEYWYNSDDPWYSCCNGKMVIGRAIKELKRLLGKGDV